MQTFTQKLLTSLLLLSLTFISGSLFADQLIMKNGDIITGNISKVADDKVFIEPSYADEYSIDIAEVASMKAEQEFDVEFTDGSILNAQFDLAADGQQIIIVDGTPKNLILTDLAEATEPEAYYDRDSHVDINITANGGNTDSRNTLIFADTRLRLGDHRHLGEITFRRDETDGTSTKKQDLLNYQYNWIFNDPWYTGITATYERDPIRDLSHRYTLGALFGRDILDNASKFLTISFGVGFSDEKIGLVSNSGSVGLWNLKYEQDLLDGDISFYHNDNLTYQFYGDNNAIFKSNTGFQFDLIDDIYAKISLRYDYETKPAQGAFKDDTTFAIGVGAEF
ncbi:MAG: DUF481 domain-containing protein [Proteobacteria bacterium]|nr:DUF481 domain-containing protein [Pseudomonadota bacterium]